MAQMIGKGEISEGRPEDDLRAFRRCLGEYTTGVTVITTSEAGTLAGITANSFASLSLDPPLVLWSIGKESRSREAFEGASFFAVNFVQADQVDTSKTFSSTQENKFESVAWREGRCGVPILDGTVGFLECRVVSRLDAGDHILIIGQVEHYAHFPGIALAFAQGQYRLTVGHPAIAQDVPRVDDGPENIPLLTLLGRVRNKVEMAFHWERVEEGISISENRVLMVLYNNPGIKLEMLAEEMYFGRVELEDAIFTLTSKGDVISSEDGRLNLTEQGRARRIAIMARTEKVGAEMLRGEEAEDVRKMTYLLQVLEAAADQRRRVRTTR